MILLGACATGPSSPDPEIEKGRRLLEAVNHDSQAACRSCMSGPLRACETLHEYPLVVLARGAKVVRDISPCNRIRNPHTGDDIDCTHLTSLRFSQMQPLRPQQHLTPRAVFRTVYEYDYWMPEKKSGVRLDPDVTYIVFARPASDSIPPKADWDIAAACPIE